MKSLVLVLAFTCAVVLAADDDQKCKADFQTFLGCVKSGFEKKSDTEKEEMKKEHRDKADKCFSDAGCNAPDWDSDPMGGAGKPQMGAMPKAVKECMKRKMIEKIGSKLNECLAKKGVNNVNFTAMADSAGSALDLEGHAGAGKEGMHGAFMAQFNAVKAVDKCAQKNGGTDASPIKTLEQCLHNIKKEAKPRICAVTKPCEEKVSSAECKKRGQDLHKALCECKNEKEADIAKKLKDIAQGQQKVPIPDLIKTVADDQEMQDMMQQVEKCYKETGEPEPPMLALAMKMLAGGGGSGGPPGPLGALSVNASTVIIMSDMMSLDAQDHSQCEPCP